MSTDTPEFWNEVWSDIEDCGSGSDEILVDQVERLTPGRALDVGCGTGSNAVWLAEQGWQVTAVDYSVVAIEKATRLAAERGVNVEFVVANVSTHQPQGHYDLITCCYVQMFPRQRTKMLAEMSKALAPGGTFSVRQPRQVRPALWLVGGRPAEPHDARRDRRRTRGTANRAIFCSQPRCRRFT